VLWLVAGVLCLGAANAVPAVPADRIVAVVADQPILESQVQSALEFLRLSMPKPESGAARTADSLLRQQVLEQLVGDQIILEQAKVETVTVNKEEVDAEIEDAVKKLKARFPDPDSFSQALVREGMTEAGLKQRYRQDVSQRLTAQKLLAKHNLLENVLVAPTEVRHFYETHKDSFGTIPGRAKLAYILLIPKPADERWRKAAEQISQAYAGLKQSGWDFDVIAGSFTNDPEMKEKSGYLGAVERGTLPEEVETVLFGLKPGEFSVPIPSRAGWVIIKREGGSAERPTTRQILIRVPVTEEDSQRTRERAAELRQQALSGADFARLARENSDDPSARENGGLLGEVFLKGLAPPYAQAVADLKAGDISAPLLAEHGYVIIKVLERVDEKTPSYEELQDDIRSYLYSQKMKARLDDFIKENRTRISVKYIQL
jgi:parvulin-like peptidyl-prolyl isomerase